MLDRIGEAIGQGLGWAARNIGEIWGWILDQVRGFFDGFARGLGVEDPGLFGWIGILIGLWLLFSAFKQIKRRRWVSMALRATIGLFIIAVSIGA